MCRADLEQAARHPIQQKKLFVPRPLGQTLSKLIDPRKFHHEYPDHEYWRYLQTGEPLRMFCGRHLAANQLRAVTVCDTELPPCPECEAGKARREGKAAA